MERPNRPPVIHVKLRDQTDADAQMTRESSLLPGMVRTPARLYGLGDDMDWAAPGSSVWDETTDAQQQQQAAAQPVRTPLTGYGPGSDVWASATASPLLDDVATAAAGAFGDSADAGGGGKGPSGAEGNTAAVVAAVALQALGEEADLTRPLVPRAAAVTAGPFSTNAARVVAAAGHHRSAGGSGTHQPYATQPSFFTVQEGPAPGAQPPGQALGPALTVLEHHGHGPAASAAATTARALPTLDDKQVAQSIIASAGLPLSMTSLISYIKDGQPQLDVHAHGGDGEAAIYGTTSVHRNYPNLSEPPPPTMPSQSHMPSSYTAAAPPPQQQQQPQQQPSVGAGSYGYGRGGRGAGGRGGSPGAYYGESAPVHSRQGFAVRAGGPADRAGDGNDSWMGVTEGSTTAGGGGWNVQATSPNLGPADPPHLQQQPHQQAYPAPYGAKAGGGGGGSYGYRGGRGGGGGGGGGGPYPRGSSGGGAFPLSQGGAVSFGPPQQLPAQQGFAGGHYGGASGGAHAGRAKSESEILSDLLHFHANFFPPPPPPRVPNAQKRSRAALWYHYASKWDITHRLPPPPRTPLPEMELEYVMQLPALTRVPYHGDGWLAMGERWFAVTQSLFDFPEENVGVELDAAVVMEQAVTS